MLVSKLEIMRQTPSRDQHCVMRLIAQKYTWLAHKTSCDFYIGQD